MSCLDDLNLVGLRDDCGVDLLTATTGYYVNDLNIPGLLEVVASAKDKSQTDAQSAIINQIDISKRLTLDLFRANTGDRYSVKTLLENEAIGEYDTPRASQAAQAFNVGLELKVIRNRYAEIQVSRIGLVVQTSGDVTVKAWDIFSGEELYSEAITTVAGIPSFLNVNWSFAGRGDIRDIFIGYDATSTATYQTLFGGVGCGSCNGGTMNLRHLQAYTRKFATGSNPQGTATAQNGTSGLMLDVSLVCNMDNFICSYGSMLAPVIWYRAGELICNYLVYSKRLSPAVIAFRDQHKELAEMYNQEWQKAFGSLLGNIMIPKSDCFKCESKNKIRTVLP